MVITFQANTTLDFSGESDETPAEKLMKTKIHMVFLLFAGVLAGAFPLLAHHGNASYDTSRSVTIKGTVTQYMWANPHVFLKVDGPDESGKTVNWIIEGQNAVTQAGQGWTKNMFKPGDQVVIEATPAKNGRPIARFKGRIFINGQELKPS